MPASKRSIRTHPAAQPWFERATLHTFLLHLLLWLGVLLTAVSWFTALAAAPLLPSTVPVHFGPDGSPDAFGAPIGILYGLPILSVALTLGMIALYMNPRFASVPGTLFIELLPERHQKMAEAIIRANIVPVMTLANLLLVYVHYSAITVALGQRSQLDVGPLAAILVLLLLTVTFYAVTSTRLVRTMIAELKKTK